MSQVAENKRNWLDEVKADAEKLTQRRLEDDGFKPSKSAEVRKRAAKAPEAEVVATKEK